LHSAPDSGRTRFFATCVATQLPVYAAGGLKAGEIALHGTRNNDLSGLSFC